MKGLVLPLPQAGSEQGLGIEAQQTHSLGNCPREEGPGSRKIKMLPRVVAEDWVTSR